MNKDSKQIPHGGVLWMNFRFWIVPLFLVAYTTILLNLFSPVPIRYDGKKEPVIPDEFKALYLPKPATPLKLWPDEQKEKVIPPSRWSLESWESAVQTGTRWEGEYGDANTFETGSYRIENSLGAISLEIHSRVEPIEDHVSGPLKFYGNLVVHRRRRSPEVIERLKEIPFELDYSEPKEAIDTLLEEQKRLRQAPLKEYIYRLPVVGTLERSYRDAHPVLGSHFLSVATDYDRRPPKQADPNFGTRLWSPLANNNWPPEQLLPRLPAQPLTIDGASPAVPVPVDRSPIDPKRSPHLMLWFNPDRTELNGDFANLFGFPSCVLRPVRD